MTLLSWLSRLGLVISGLVRYQGVKGEFSKGPMMASCLSSVRMNLSTWSGKFVADEWLVAFVSGGWLPM